MATYQVDGGCFTFTPFEELVTELTLATMRRQYMCEVATRDLRTVIQQFEDMTDYIRLCASNDAYADELLKRVEGRS